LPEHADNGSNYDYRYAWIRDQAITGVNLSSAGPLPLVGDAVRVATARLLQHGPELRPAYTVNGDDVPAESTLQLPGYPGADAIVGNRASAQFQLDVFGECLELLARGAELDLIDTDGRRAAEIAVRTVQDRWDDKDAGIWELHDEWWAQSRLSCVAGLRAWAAVADRARSTDLTKLADDLLGDVARRCVSPSGAWRCAPHDERVDAALLLPLVRGATPPSDPRTTATMQTVRRELMQDGYVYRFAPRSGDLGSDEGAFLFCGFLMSLAELREGNLVAAGRCFERNRASCGTPGLFAEEFDVRQRQLRGNLPQAFVHGMAFEAAVQLAARTGTSR
jgi:GH15 family glucan-1,4-alpha-glucosidase